MINVFMIKIHIENTLLWGENKFECYIRNLFFILTINSVILWIKKIFIIGYVIFSIFLRLLIHEHGVFNVLMYFCHYLSRWLFIIIFVFIHLHLFTVWLNFDFEIVLLCVGLQILPSNYCCDITEILLKVVLNTISNNQTIPSNYVVCNSLHSH